MVGAKPSTDQKIKMPTRKKPTAIKIAEGNRAKVGKKHLRPDVAGLGRPRIPSNLTADERKIFVEVVASLPPELMTRADEGCLEQYVVAWARFRRMKKIIDDEDEVLSGPNGKYRHPALIVLEKASLEMSRCGSLLGLSPVARARLAAPSSGPDDPMAALLGMDNAEGDWTTQPTTRN